MVAGLWLLQLGRVWYNIPVLFPDFSAFFSPRSLGNPNPWLSGREQSLR